MVIIHIAGTSGAGKTTLGLKLKKELGSKLVHKDLDEFNYRCRKKKDKKIFDVNCFNKLVSDFIKNNKGKNILFTGYNVFNYDLWAEVPADYKFFINIPNKDLLKQVTLRSIDYC